MKKTLLLTLLLFLFLTILIVFISSFVIGERSSFFGRATTGVAEGEISADNSYLFASPLQAKAGDSEKIRVTAFILNSKGFGVNGKKVSLASDKGINITEIQAITDTYGKAVFDVTATNPGDYLIQAGIDGSILPQKVKVSFK